jgi:hypothetical protein
VRDKVTDLIFRAKIMGSPQVRSAYNPTAAVHEEVSSYGVAENLREIGAAAPTEGGAGGEQASAGDESEGPVAVKQIVRNEPKVGRNDLCPCGSGKKYKKCCGASAA